MEQVTSHVLDGRRLFRASSPNYGGGDITQRLTEEAVDFLTQQKIDRIISLNQFPYEEAELSLLKSAGIEYLHLSVRDFTAPSLDQFLRAAEFYSKQPNATTLVHCGAGFGRTGTCVTALQLYQSHGEAPPREEWARVNHVERPAQINVLVQVQKHYGDSDEL